MDRVPSSLRPGRAQPAAGRGCGAGVRSRHGGPVHWPHRANGGEILPDAEPRAVLGSPGLAARGPGWGGCAHPWARTGPPGSSLRCHTAAVAPCPPVSQPRGSPCTVPRPEPPRAGPCRAASALRPGHRLSAVPGCRRRGACWPGRAPPPPARCGKLASGLGLHCPSQGPLRGDLRQKLRNWLGPAPPPGPRALAPADGALAGSGRGHRRTDAAPRPRPRRRRTARPGRAV